MKKPRTFRRRIFIYIVLLISAVSFSFAFVYMKRERTMVENGLESRGSIICSMLAGSSRLGLFSGNSAYLAGPLKGVLDQKEVLQAVVYDSKGAPLARESKKEVRPIRDPASVIEQLRREGHSIYLKGKGHDEFWVPVTLSESRIGAGLYPENGHRKMLLGFTEVVLGKSEMRTEAVHIAESAFLMAIIFITAGVLAAYLVTDRLIGPLNAFVLRIRRMGISGIEKTPVTGDAEIAALAEAFNSMVDELALKEDQRLAAERLKNQLAAAVESTKEAVIISDPEGRIIYLNPAFEIMTGFERTEVLGKNLNLPAASAGIPVQEALAEAVSSRSSWAGRCSGLTKAGDYFVIEGSISPVKGPSGEVANYVMVQHDITEREKLESVAQSVELMNNTGYIFAGIRHEIGNPLQSIKMTITVFQKILEQSGGPEAGNYLDYLGRIQQDMSRIEFLLKSIKSFNIYEKMEFAELDPHEFLSEFVKFIRADFDRKGIKVELDSKPGMGLARIDPRAMQQIFLNLVINAADAMAGLPSPRIDVLLSRSQDAFVIKIKDYGPGMTEQQRKEIFKPFYTTKEKGTGLGLVLVKKMLLKMDGEINIESRQGKGTTVIIRIPAFQ